jgi:hypothetical protein
VLLAVLAMLPILQRQSRREEKGLTWMQLDAPPANESSKHKNISVYQVDATTHQGKNRTHEQATYIFSRAGCMQPSP